MTIRLRPRGRTTPRPGRPARAKGLWALALRHGAVMAAALALVAAGLVISLQARTASAATTTLIVNSTAWGGPDANPGNGVCETAAGNGVCTLRAAIEESNALKGQPGDILITVATTIQLNTPMTGTANATANFMLYTSTSASRINSQDTAGAQYVISAPVIIDLAHRLQANSTANDSNTSIMFYITGSDVQILNGDQVLGSGSSFVVSPTARNVTISGDTGGGLGQISATANWVAERFVIIMQGAQNVTVSNYQVRGFYKASYDGIFVFHNPTSGSVPTNVTQNVVVDRVQVFYNPSGGSCGSSNGSGCNTRLLNFWQGTTDGGSSGGYANNVINGLSFTNMLVQDMPDDTDIYGFQFSYQGSMSTASSDITNLVIENNQFLRNAAHSTNPSSAFVTLPYAQNLHGTNSISNNVFTSSYASGSQTGQYSAIYLVGNRTAGSTTASYLTIANNHFNGYGSSGAIRAQAAGLVTVTGNTFGSATKAYSNASEETSDTSVMFSNSPGTTPYQSSNQAILTWTPTPTNATVATGPATDSVLTLDDPRAGALPTCPATVTATKPTAAVSNSTVPADPVTLQAYWTSAQTAEVYLGQVSGVTGPNAKLLFQLPVGPVTLPDGGTAQIVNPTTGVVNGFVRLQTQVQGLAQLESSQYSRTAQLTGSCAPAVSLDQAQAQPDPTMTRDIHFTLTSSLPLDPATLTPGDVSLAGSTAANARVTSIVPAGDGLTFDIVARADDSGTIQLSLPAGVVTSLGGFANTAASSSPDNVVTYTNPLTVVPTSFALVTGDPKGKNYTIEVSPLAPPPTAVLVFATTLDQAAQDYGLQLSTITPYIQPGSLSATVNVTAPAQSVSANTTTLLTHTVVSGDPNYDALVVPSVSPRLFSTDPVISIVKQAYVGVTGANTAANIMASGTLVPSGSRLTDGTPVWFVFTVANTSADDWATTLTGISVTDDVLGGIDTIPSLVAGTSAAVVYAKNPVAIEANGPAPQVAP